MTMIVTGTTPLFKPGFSTSRPSTAPSTEIAGVMSASQKKNAVPISASATATLDRKSTRLNSSHDQISYAVFCLKKKRCNGRREHRDRRGDGERRNQDPTAHS